MISFALATPFVCCEYGHASLILSSLVSIVGKLRLSRRESLLRMLDFSYWFLVIVWITYSIQSHKLVIGPPWQVVTRPVPVCIGVC